MRTLLPRLPALAPLIAACSCSTSAQTGRGPQEPDPRCVRVEEGYGPEGTVPLEVEVVARNLEIPWGMAFLPNGDVLVTERPGRVRIVRSGVLAEQPIATVEVAHRGEGGLLGIALHPEFSTNRSFYLYYTTANDNRIQRFELGADGTTVTPGEVILEGIPAARVHNGGRLHFGPDGMLWACTGDAQDRDLSQQRDNLAGKVLRLAPDGQVPADNPWPGNHAAIEGVRNCQGIGWLDESTLVVADHGPSGEMGIRGNDEVSVARAGENLGWPQQIGCDVQEGMVTAAISWRQAVPPGGGTVYRGEAMPEFAGDFFLGALGARHLQRIRFGDDRQVVGHEVYLRDAYGRLRDVQAGPDGALWITTSNCDGRGTCPDDGDYLLRVTRR